MQRRTSMWHRTTMTRLARALILLVALALPRLAVAQGSSALADSIRALEDQRARALLAADTVALSRMIADDFVEISRTAQLRTKADNLREIGTGALKLLAMRFESQTVRVYGDVAILQGIADNTGLFRGAPFEGRLRYTRVFVRRPSGWVAVAMQHTMIP
jgi:ketosteroid isomerase-like protein